MPSADSLPPATPPSPAVPSASHAGGGVKRIVFTTLKILIAALGIWWVCRMVSWRDTAVVPAGTTIRSATLTNDTEVIVLGEHALPNAAANEPRRVYSVQFPDKPLAVTAEMNGHLIHTTIDDQNRDAMNFPRVMELPPTFFKMTDGTVVRQGLRSILILGSSHWPLLLAAWVILVIPFFVSAIRWRNLMRPQGINLSFGKCLQLTFVGQFYSIMLPGVTGGDLVKIVYAARLTGSKTKSLITVLLDRVIGLVALMVIGGASAAWQLLENQRAGGGAAAADPTLRNVLLLICGILAGMGLFCLIYFSHRLRSATGLQKLINHPRMPEFVKHADEVLHTYRGHFGLIVWAFCISLVSQLTLPLSAWMSGMAFGVQMHVGYYLAYVPVAILAASLPISPPQGVGMLEWVINHFFMTRGLATASQAFILTQAIRFLPMLWNLIGAYWVLTGSFSRHKMHEQELEIEAAEHPTS